MRKILASIIAGTGLCLVTGGFGFAADMPMPMKAPPAPVPAFSWTGCYVGAQGGIGAETDGFAQGNLLGLGGLGGGLGGLGGNGSNGYGAVAGGQVGCNYQTGMLVVGIEGDGLWSGVKNKSGASEIGGGVTLGAETNNRWDFDVAARVGAAFDRLLVYGKGGVAWGRFDFSETESVGGATVIAFTGNNAKLPGVLIGVGMEYAFFANWTAKIEYNYIAYVQQSVGFTVTGAGAPPGIFFTENLGATEQLIKFGVNYKFF